MELWIRSQDKEKFLPIDKPIVYDFSEFGSHRIIYKESASYAMNLGSYKSKERALEVLDEIQEAQLGNYHYRCPSNVKVSNNEDTIVYEMPKD
jgi:hypothetical protein